MYHRVHISLWAGMGMHGVPNIVTPWVGIPGVVGSLPLHFNIGTTPMLHPVLYCTSCLSLTLGIPLIISLAF